MRRFAGLWIVATLCFPVITRASTAGFPGGSFWLSTAAASEGDTVTMYTAVYDASDSPLTATVAFRVDGAQVDGIATNLKPGESRLVSYDWHATVGTHSLDAVIRDAAPVDADAVSNAVTIDVAAKPPSALATYTADAQTAANEATPVISQAANTIYGATEALRSASVNTLSKALSAATSSAPHVDGHVLGASTHATTSNVAAANAASSDTLDNIWQTMLQSLLAMCKSQPLFYAFLIVSMLFLIWIFRRMMRESVR